MGRRNSRFLYVRLAVLLLLLAGALQLFLWSRAGDPRFYYFLTTPPGRAMARFFHWHVVPLDPLAREKPIAGYTAEELRVKEQLEESLRGSAPTHRLVLRDGKSLFGRLIEEGAGSILFQESFGNSGSLSAQFRRNRILQLDPVALPLPAISYRDVRFKMEFPELNLYKREPYTIVTDEKYFRVEGNVRLLQRLHADFFEVFRPLMTRADHAGNIQLLFYSNENAFRAYQRRYAPSLGSSVGFYSPWMDRFVVFNQEHSEEMAAFGRRLESQAEDYRAQEEMYGGAGRIEQWKKEAGSRMVGLARQQTQDTLRHEAAHQLFFAYGIHSPHRIENEWLYEGLAVYCEPEVLGSVVRLRAGLAQQALDRNGLLPLETLVNHRSGRGLFTLGTPEEVELAYCESWSLVHFLMRPEYRQAFFSYIRYIRDRDRFFEVLRQPCLDVLCRHLGLTPAEFDTAWRAHLDQM